MRLKAYDLNLVSIFYCIGLRPLENFLQAIEAVCVEKFRPQNQLKIMDFQSLKRSGGKTRLFFQFEHQNME